MKNFDFDKDTSENSFPQPYMSYMANERLQGEGQFHSKSYLLKMLRCHCQNAFEKCITKTELCNSKSYIRMLYIRLCMLFL